MQKAKRKIKDSFLLISLLDKDSLTKLNKIFNTYYSAKQVKKNIRVQRTSRKFKFWDKLIREKPGFDRQGDNG